MQAGRRHADPRAILALVCEPAGMDERCLDEVPFKRVIARDNATLFKALIEELGIQT